MALALLVSGPIPGVALLPQWAYFWMILMPMVVFASLVGVQAVIGYAAGRDRVLA